MGVWHNNRVDTTYFTARIDEAGVQNYRSLTKTTACIRGKLGNWQVGKIC